MGPFGWARTEGFLRARSFLVGLAALATSAFVAASAAASSSGPVSLPPDPQRIERLRSHGLAPTADVIVYFLEQGFAPGTRLEDLPPVPAFKTQVIVDAIVEAGRQRMAKAAPILARVVEGRLTPGMKAILQWDLAQQRASERDDFKQQVLKALRHDAIVALGLIGDPAFGYPLRRVMSDDKDPDMRIASALAMATMGSRAGLPYLIREVSRANRTSSPAAAQALRMITGLDYGPAADDPVSRRRAAAKAWKKWWSKEGKTFRPDPERVLARRMTPAARPIPRDPQTVRDLVDCIAYPTDARWTIDAYDAYERLRILGRRALEELEAIVDDKDENLRIRSQAIALYARMATLPHGSASGGSDPARRAYKKLRWLRWFDRNPEIRQAARRYLPQVRRAK